MSRPLVTLLPAPRRLLRAAAPILAATALVVASSVAAHGGEKSEAGDQAICHATHSEHNPYVTNSPARSGDLNGHAGHTGPLWSAGLKADHVQWGDIVPPFDYPDGDGTAHFDGLNWSDAGQAIFLNGCTVPPPALSLTVVKTNDADKDGEYSDAETSTVAGADVAFHVTITNTSAVSVVIDSITDAVGQTSIPVTCATPVVGTAVAPGASVTCAFTATGYAPADRGKVRNTATVKAHEGSDGEEGDEDRSNTVCVSDTSEVRTVATRPDVSLSVVKTNDANGDGSYHATETAALPGQDVAFRVVVTNTSPVQVALDSLTDVIGGGDAAAIACAAALPAVLDADASATCDFVLTGISPAAGSSLVDTATAKAHERDYPANKACASSTSTVRTAEAPKLPDLAIAKSGPASVSPGGVATYTLTVTNTGTGTAQEVVVDDAVPAHTTLTGLTAAGWTCTGEGVHCTLDASLEPAASAAITVAATLEADYAASTVVNTATVGPTDETPDDNTSTVTTRVPHAPDLSIVKTGPASVVAGESLTWTLTVTNDGNATADVVTVTDAIPAGVTPGAVVATGWTCTGTTAVSCTLDTPLADGDSASLTISATVPADYTDPTVSNTGVVGPEDATPADNTSTAVTDVTQVSSGGGGTTTGGGGTFTGGGGQLAFTGDSTMRWAQDGIALVLVGLLLLVAGRARSRLT